MLALAAFSPGLVVSPAVRGMAPAPATDVQMKLSPWAQPAMAAAAMAAALTFAPVDPAFAAKSGGRVGGRVTSTGSVKSSADTKTAKSSANVKAAAPAAAPAPQVTNVYMTQPMGYGGYGGGGGSGMGLFVGAELVNMYFKEQQRQAYLKQQLEVQQQLGADSAKIAELQRMLSEQNAKVDSLAAQKNAQSAASLQPQAAPGEAEMQMQMQLIQQQKELELIKQGKAPAALVAAQ